MVDAEDRCHVYPIFVSSNHQKEITPVRMRFIEPNINSIFWIWLLSWTETLDMESDGTCLMHALIRFICILHFLKFEALMYECNATKNVPYFFDVNQAM